MTDLTDAKRAQYTTSYGASYSATPPDFSRCAKQVFKGRGWGRKQCTRPCGHGPEGAWCKQHDPVARKAKLDAAAAAYRAKYSREAMQAALKAEAMTILAQIANGHNDARDLAADYLKRRKDAGL